MRVTELLTEVKGREKEGTDACTSYQQEKAKRLVLEKRCADLELVNDSLRQENLVSVLNTFTLLPCVLGNLH